MNYTGPKLSEQLELDELLVAGAAAFSIDLDYVQRQQFATLARELVAWNQRASLTSITDPRDIAVKHFVDSLSAAPLAQSVLGDHPGTLVDVGSGGGLPGLALAIALPTHSVTLVEATGKKVRFLQHIIPLLGLENTVVVSGRVEDVARHPEQRERFNLAISRAVGSVASLIELLVPLLQVGGTAVLMKSRAQVGDEVAVAGRALRELHSRIEQVSDVPLRITEGDRVLVEVRKNAASPERYPRRSGLPQRRPLVGP